MLMRDDEREWPFVLDEHEGLAPIRRVFVARVEHQERSRHLGPR
jgi:hypothetical protein